MHNISGHQMLPPAQTGRSRGAVGQAGVRLVVPTLAALSVLRPGRPAAGGRRSKPKRTTAVAPWLPGPSSVARPVASGKKRTGVRVRESVGAAQPAAYAAQDTQACGPVPLSGLSGKKKKERKTGRAQRRRPPTGRSEAVSCAGSRRKQRRAQALDDFAVVRARRSAQPSHQHGTRHDERDVPSPDRQRTGRFYSCTGARVDLRQDNFHRIHANLDGCYGLAEDVFVQGDQARAVFPVGNSTHPFTGLFHNPRFELRVHLERSSGDAVLFGAIQDAEIALRISDSRLVTHNGSRAALAGEMQDNNWMGTVHLRDSLFKATGAGTVQVGLVGTTLGAGNVVAVHEASGTSMQALSVGASDSCPRAVASLGLGLLHSSARQDVYQHVVRGNRLQARADSGWATAAMLAVFDQPHNDAGSLRSVQRGLHDNSLLAEGGVARHAGGCSGGSSASLGYGDVQCAAPGAVRSPTRLRAAQVEWFNNSARALPLGSQVPGGAADSRTCTSLVSTAVVDSVQLQQRGLAPGQRQDSLEERSLLPAARDMALFLFYGGDGQLPLLAAGSNGTGNMTVNVTGFVDTASFQWAPAGDSRAFDNRLLVRGSSVQPAGWREAFQAFRDSESVSPTGWPFLNSWSCKGQDAHSALLHYPGEQLQSMTPFEEGWVLLTRQRYPWQQDNDLKGLLRVTRYGREDFDPGNPWVEGRLVDGEILLYQPHGQDVLAQDARAGYSLVQGHLLHQMYQRPGGALQLVSLALNETDSHYQLRHYDELAGQARLLSVEDGQLHLWMQQEDEDTLLVYGLGTAPLAPNTSSWLRWGFELSGQPGGPVVLARDGQWLYSLRQAARQAASLRRWQMDGFVLDPDWQSGWPGRVTQDLRLTRLHGRRLVGVTATELISPVVPYSPLSPFGRYRLQLSSAGGCLQQLRHGWPPWRSLPAVPAAPVSPTTAEPSPSLASTLPVLPASGGPWSLTRSPWFPAVPVWFDGVLTAIFGVGTAFLAVGLVGCLVCSVRSRVQQIQRRRAAQSPARRQQQALELGERHSRQQRLPPSEQAAGSGSREPGSHSRDAAPSSLPCALEDGTAREETAL